MPQLLEATADLLHPLIGAQIVAYNHDNLHATKVRGVNVKLKSNPLNDKILTIYILHKSAMTLLTPINTIVLKTKLILSQT
jgi:hypothetical protein